MASRPMIAAEVGVSSAGLRTTVLPQARAGATFHVSSMSGKFQGAIATTTPAGSNRLYAWWPESMGNASATAIFAWSAKNRKLCAARATS